MSATKTQIKPAFKVCENNVQTPTILIEPFDTEGDPQVWIQWYGKSERADLKDMQFRFPIPMAPNADDWFGHPERFKVILFGPISKFPNQGYARQFANEHLSGDTEGTVLYVISSHVGVDDGNGGTIPIAFLVPMNIKLADDEVGIISPGDYYEPKVQQSVIDEFYGK